MKKKRWRAGACLLLVLGILLAGVSLVKLLSIRDVLEYAVTAPQGSGAKDQVKALVTAKEKLAETLADCTTATAIGGILENASVSAGGQSGSAAVYAVGEGWFEVYPVFMMEGRRLSETELKNGDAVAMLDADLAFDLFGGDIPEDAKVTIGESEYRVVGTVRHERSVGEKAEHCVYVPLMAALETGLDTLMVSSVPIPNSGARTLFESTLRNSWQDGGSFYSIEKEVMRRTIILRLALLVFGLSVIFALTRRMSAFMARRAGAFREGMRWNYFPRMIPSLAGLIGLGILGYGALLAVLYGLMAFSIQPLYVFTEWVPENIVEWSSLKAVFWNLVSASAKLVKVGTPQMRAVEFWGGLLRWGTISTLWGALLTRRRA